MPRHIRRPRLEPAAGQSGWAALSTAGEVGRGPTAADARDSARLTRSKEAVQITYFPTEQAQPLELPIVFERVRAAIPDATRVWLVGGSVRDALLRRPVQDLDFAVQGDGLATARGVANALKALFFPIDEARGTGRAILEHEGRRFFLDFASLRGPDLNADLAARDFTVNAIALSLTGHFIDPLGGQADLRAKLLRHCSPSAIDSDPVRALRLIRLAAQLEFRVERATREAARRAASTLGEVSAERVRDEFVKMLGGRKPAASLRALDTLGLLGRIAPEVVALKGVSQSAPHVYDAWDHTLAVVDHLERLLFVLGPVHDVDAASEYALGYAAARVGRFRRAVSDHLGESLSAGRDVRSILFLAALLHDVGKPAARSVEPGGRIRFLQHERIGERLARERAQALKLAGDEVERVATIVRHHMRPVTLAQAGAQAVTGRAVYRFFRATGQAGVDICLLSLADMLGMRGLELGQAEWAERVNTVVALLDGYYARAEVINPPALLSGEDVMGLGISQGPRVGELLEAVREAQADGEVNTRDQAEALVRKLLEEQP